MILKCTYNGNPCVDSLDLIYTSLGGCYSFNARHRNIPTADGAGPEWGLTLLLNVSQDEYSYGPSSSAGFKVLVIFVCFICNKKAALFCNSVRMPFLKTPIIILYDYITKETIHIISFETIIVSRI